MKIEYTHEWFINNVDTFAQWFDAETFDWNWCNYLAKFHSERFDCWWDADKFNWTNSAFLPVFCSHVFETWWDPERYNWNRARYLKWHCIEHIDTWYDEKRCVKPKEMIIWDHLQEKMNVHLHVPQIQ